MSIGQIVVLSLGYICIAIVVGIITYSASDPYDHFSATYDITEAVLIGIFWIPIFAYLATIFTWIIISTLFDNWTSKHP